MQEAHQDIKRYDFKSGLPIEFEILNIEHLYKNHKNILGEPHRAEFYHIIWIQEGSPTHYIDFTPITMKPNSLLFVTKNCVNIFDTTSDYRGKLLLFTDNFFYKLVNHLSFLQNTILFNDLFDIAQIDLNQSNAPFAQTFRLMEIESNQAKDQYQVELLRNLLHNFLLLSERERKKQGFKEIKPGIYLDYFLLFKDLLNKNFIEHKLVSKYAEDLCISEKTLNTTTTQIIGKTPKQLIDARIILEAKRLLVYSHANIKSIAFELGFDEPTNFIKYFKKHVKKTPVEFREVF